jgi:hypothetical protein
LTQSDTDRPILIFTFVRGVKESFQYIYEVRTVYRRLTEITILRNIGEVSKLQKYPDKSNSLTFREKGLIGTLEVHDPLFPEEFPIARDSSIERPTDDDTFAPFARITWKPRVHSMELEPEGHTIFPEEATDFVRVHRVVVIHRLYTTSETLRISTTDVGDFTNRKNPIDGFYLFSIPDDGRVIGFVEVSEHLRPDTCRRNPDGYGYTDIVVDISLE